MGYVLAGYVVTFAVLVAYALRVLTRERALRRADADAEVDAA